MMDKNAKDKDRVKNIDEQLAMIKKNIYNKQKNPTRTFKGREKKTNQNITQNNRDNTRYHNVEKRFNHIFRKFNTRLP